MKIVRYPHYTCVHISVCFVIAAGICFAQSDPGPRGAPLEPAALIRL